MDELINLLKTDASAANAMGALASAAAAFLAVVVSVLAMFISFWAVRSQHKHNELSVRPLAEVTVADYENSLRVKLCNNGNGPMIIKWIEVSNRTKAKTSIIEFMPILPNNREWTTFSSDLCDRTLKSGDEIVLLELTMNDGETNFNKSRDKVRTALAPLSVRVKYTDIYNKKMPTRIKSLSWFGRHKETD
ncbi:MAG: hypothetical protein AB2603_12035 [Candidatus Thiodiazotropha endolucinida]